MLISKKRIFVKIDKLISMFEKIVNERNKDNKEQEEANEQTINDFLKKYEDKTFDLQISREDLETCFKSLKNGKSIGFHGISNENLKYALSDKLLDYIEVILIVKVMPADFNISILKPLIKDLTKSSVGPSNLRSVAI
jgi:hypothetical protein